jgi:hypothetical protein
MVALRWCDEDEAGQQQEAVARLAGAGSPSREARGLQLVPPGVAYPVGRAGSVVRRRPQTFFWRRAIAISVLIGLGAMAWLVTGRFVSAAGAQAPQGQQCLSGGVPGGGQSAGSCGQAYVARSGDTIWSIAVAYSRGGDPRPLVANLESQIGGGVLQPGERLVLPGR